MTDTLSEDLQLPACPSDDCDANRTGLFTIRSASDTDRFECVKCGHRWS